MNFDKLMKIMGSLDEEGKDRLEESVASFFSETLFLDPFICENHTLDLTDFKEKVGAGIFNPAFMCAVEFFVSNEYPKDSGNFNAIDFLIRKKGPLLSAQDRAYLKGLRDSYMSIYEVVDIKINQSITLRDLLEENNPPLILKEKKGTYSLCQWDIVGARIIKTPLHNFSGGGILLLSRDTFHKTKEIIQKISKTMMTKKYLRLFQKITKDPTLLVKKMWVKEIVENWFMQNMKDSQEPVYLNYDGSPLQLYTLEFPITSDLHHVLKKLNALPKLVPHDIEDVPHAWIWPLETDKKNPHPMKQSSTEEAAKEIYIDTQLSVDDGMVYRLFAELQIKGKKLIIDVNSEHRANIVENAIQTHLDSLIGQAKRIKHDLKKSNVLPFSKKPSLEISCEKDEALTRNFFDQHYKEWLDTPLPILKGKTPRQAAKTKTGLPFVINLLKDMQNNNLRAKKQGHSTQLYNFDWLFDELGIEKRSL